MDKIDDPVPIDVFGNSFKKFFIILAYLSICKNAIICIDEIENGLHYSIYEQLWINIFRYADKNNIQLFITTQSIEMLNILKILLTGNAFKYMRDSTNIFAIDTSIDTCSKVYKLLLLKINL